MLNRVKAAFGLGWSMLRGAAIVALVPAGLRWLFVHDSLRVFLITYAVFVGACLLLLVLHAIIYLLLSWLSTRFKR